MALVEWSLSRPVRTLVLLLLLTLAGTAGLSRLELRTDGSALVPRNDPAVAADAEIRAHFGLRDPIVVLVETAHPDGIYNFATLERVAHLTEALAAIEGVEVTSLATEHRQRVFPGTLDFRTFLEPLPDTAERMADLRADVELAGILGGTLVSKAPPAAPWATTLLVGVPAGDGTLDRQALYRRVRAAADRFEVPDDRILVVGAPVAEAMLGTHILEDLALLLPLSMAVIAAVIALGCRRLWGVLLGLSEVGAALAFTFGVMGWSGTPVYLTTAVLPVVLTTLGLADEIHIFWHYQRALAAAPVSCSHVEVVRSTLRDMVRPVTLTTLTTALAFLAFLWSSIPPVRSFGLFAALGILFCWLWSLTVVPAALALLGGQRMRREGELTIGRGGRSRAIFERVIARPVAVWLAILLVSAVSAVGASRLFVQDSWVDGFARGSPFRRATERAHQALLGTHLLIAHLDFRSTGGPAQPLLNRALLDEIRDFEAHARSQPGVGGVLGAHSHLQAVTRMWLAREEIPRTRDRLDLLLRRFDQGRGEHRRREVIDDARERTVITVFLENANYLETAHLMSALRAWSDEHLKKWGAKLSFAGDVAVSQAMIPAIVSTQLGSLLIALAGVVLVLGVLLRSLRFALLAVLPSAVTVLWVLGAMGWAGIPLGVATSMFCAITLGVGVDYAIHLLESHRRARHRGASRPVLVSLEEAGGAIVFDTLAIALGFGLLVFSQVPANGRLGLLVALSLSASCVLTLAGLGATLARIPLGRRTPSEP